MGIGLDITKELATIGVTLTELTAITRMINRELKNSEFGEHFNEMVADLGKAYEVVTTNLLPLCEFDTEAGFIKTFDAYHDACSACYLTEISKPRNYGEAAYEEYLLLQTVKESKTSHPLLNAASPGSIISSINGSPMIPGWPCAPTTCSNAYRFC